MANTRVLGDKRTATLFAFGALMIFETWCEVYIYIFIYNELFQNVFLDKTNHATF